MMHIPEAIRKNDSYETNVKTYILYNNLFYSKTKTDSNYRLEC